MNALLAQYAVERLLYRISCSSQSDRFVLKGAMLFRAWTGSLHRPTQDVDLLGYGAPEPEGIAETFAAIVREVSDESDGLVFDDGAVTAEEIRGVEEYGGVRVRVPATLGTARVVVQVDVGFGDAITPEAIERKFPPLLDHTAPRIRAYPPETAVAEKLEAICSIGIANSRMKDYYDLITISRRFDFDGRILAQAIAATFVRRDTQIPTEQPVGLSERFAEDELKQTQWGAFLNRTRLPDAPNDLGEVLRLVCEFVEPPLNAASAADGFTARWLPGHGWQEAEKPGLL